MSSGDSQDAAHLVQRLIELKKAFEVMLARQSVAFTDD